MLSIFRRWIDRKKLLRDLEALERFEIVAYGIAGDGKPSIYMRLNLRFWKHVEDLNRAMTKDVWITGPMRLELRRING